MNDDPSRRLCSAIVACLFFATGLPQAEAYGTTPHWHAADQATDNCILAQFGTVAYDSLTCVSKETGACAAMPRFAAPIHAQITSNRFDKKTATVWNGAPIRKDPLLKDVPPSKNVSALSDMPELKDIPAFHNLSGHDRIPVQSAIAVFDEVRNETPTHWKHETLDDFTITAYAVSYHSTGKSPSSPGFGITYSGTHATVRRTIAVDPRVIPIGSLVYIEGIGWRIAEDVGGAVKGRHIDLLMRSDDAAIQFGVRHHVRVYVMP